MSEKRLFWSIAYEEPMPYHPKVTPAEAPVPIPVATLFEEDEEGARKVMRRVHYVVASDDLV